MSDIQDLIARNATMAYNEGVEHGARKESERISSILIELVGEFARKEELTRYLATALKRINND